MIDVPCARRRNLAEAFALRRMPGELLYVKAPNPISFFFPDGRAQPSIWAQRPLLVGHVKYAAGDVVVLLIMSE